MIRKHHVALGVIGGVMALAFVIGLAVTPYVHGQPVLLSPPNRELKTYLDMYTARLASAEKEQTNLMQLLNPTRPGAAAASVFDLSQKARTAQANLNDLARQVEQTRVPSGLSALDEDLRAALAAELDLADKVLTFSGRGDETTRGEALAAGVAAQAALTTARQTHQTTLR